MADLINLTIDGVPVAVPKGTLIVDAAKRIGNDIPVFCYHPKLKPVGMCRMCLVEVDGMHGTPASCTTPVADGMVVHTQTDEIATIRKRRGAQERRLPGRASPRWRPGWQVQR